MCLNAATRLQDDRLPVYKYIKHHPGFHKNLVTDRSHSSTIGMIIHTLPWVTPFWWIWKMTLVLNIPCHLKLISLSPPILIKYHDVILYLDLSINEYLILEP